MRLIDADALMLKLEGIGEAERQIYGIGSWNFVLRCMNAIKLSPTIEPDPHWISCKEWMPKVGQKVVICELDDIISVCRLMESVEGELFWEDGFNYRWGVYKNYTEWIPLPESYKEKVENE